MPAHVTPHLARALVGRETELDALRQAWSSGGVATLVRGPAGIGKTRLVRELRSWAVAKGGVVLVGRSTASARTAPLRPIREALLGAARQGVRPGDDLAPYVPALASIVPDWATGASIAPESELLLGEALLRLMMSVAGTPPALLVIEDVQWADTETLALVEYLVDNVHGLPVTIVLTMRDGEHGDGTDVATSLVQRRAAGELVLLPLGADRVVELASACLGGHEVPAGSLDSLVDRSEGIPFLVEELVATAAGAGWASVAADVPGSVATSVRTRLDSMPEPARRLLTAAALLGRSFDWAVAARTAGLADADAVDHLRHGVQAQLVEIDGAGFRFRHALTRDAVLTTAPPGDLALLARRALGELVGDDEDGSRLDPHGCLLAAELADRAGEPRRAARFLTGAARQMLAGGALDSAGQHARRARLTAPDEDTAEIDRLLLEISVRAGQTEEAVELGAGLLQRCGRDERPEIHLLLGAANLAAGRWHEAEGHAREAVGPATDDDIDDDDDVDTDVERRARASVLAAQAAMGRDEVDVAVQRATTSLADARAAGLIEVQCEALEVLGRAERGRDLALAEAAFQEAHDIADAAGLPLWRVRAVQELGTIDMYGSLEVDRLLRARREAVELGALATAAVVDLQLGAVYDERGELDLALAAARRCEAASRRWKLSTLAMSLVVQAMVHARRADREAMESALSAARETGQDVDYVDAGAWGNVEPVYHLVLGDVAEAAAVLDRGMDVVRKRPAAALPYPGLWALTRTLIDEGGDAARAEVAGLPFDTPVSRSTLVAAEAVALGRSGDAVAAGARFATADRGLSPAGGGFRRPFTRLLVARAAHRDGWGDPVAWLREALASFERLGLDALTAQARRALRAIGAPVPRHRAAATAASVPSMLAELSITTREVDVLVLVAEGATNREIAERLFISPRTVDKHVERLLQKTGASRRGLAVIARDAGLLRT